MLQNLEEDEQAGEHTCAYSQAQVRVVAEEAPETAGRDGEKDYSDAKDGLPFSLEKGSLVFSGLELCTCLG